MLLQKPQAKKHFIYKCGKKGWVSDPKNEAVHFEMINDKMPLLNDEIVIKWKQPATKSMENLVKKELRKFHKTY
jgi:nicotinic acid phosphoribosyltransferase